MRRALELLVAATLTTTLSTTLSTTDVSAQEAPEKRKFYGQQVLATAYGGQALMLHGAFTESYLTIGAGAFSWVFGGAFVHAAHGRAGAAIASPFIEASPIVLALLAYSASDRRSDDTNAGIVLFFSSVAAPILDAMLLGYETEKRAPTVSWSVAPNLTRDRFGLSLGGSF